MADKRHPTRGVIAPPDLQRRVAAILHAEGPRAAARRLGVHREPLLNIAVGVPVLAGTVALVRERLRKVETDAA